MLTISKHLAFSPEFTAAVEAKQVAQQEAQRAAFVVDKARQEKQATVVRAQGEARSAELIGDAIKKSRSYVDLREFENARQVAQILQQSANKVLVYNYRTGKSKMQRSFPLMSKY